MGKVIYLTGAPATGKSTLGRALSRRVKNLKLFSYSQELRDHVISNEAISESDIRRQSSRLITFEHVSAVDKKLIDLVSEERNSKSIVIDSHAVTKEDYGFRVTPFSSSMLEDLAPDVIVCLYASAEVIIRRIANDAAGRPTVSEEEANMHCFLQNALATQYSVLLGKPCYLINTDLDEEALFDVVLNRLKLE